MEASINSWIETELKHAKSAFVPWGREVIRAIDMDDYIKLANIFESSLENSSPINFQTNLLGYGGHIWTPWLHNFLGDTALHLSIKQSKQKCIEMLLMLGADSAIINRKGESSEDLMIKILKATSKDLKFKALRNILEYTHPKDMKLLPKRFVNCRGLEEEAWKLMESGRILYTEQPNSFLFNDVVPRKSPGYIEKRKNELEAIMEKITTNNEFDNALLPNWVSVADDNGNQYYINEVTNESTWERPIDKTANTNDQQISKIAIKKTEIDEISLDEEAENYLEKLNRDEESSDDILKLKLRIREMHRLEQEQKRELAIKRRERGTTPEMNDELNDDEVLIQTRLELEALNNEIENKVDELTSRRKQQAIEERTGISETVAAQAMGDVWSRGTLSDIIRIIKQQHERLLVHEQMMHSRHENYTPNNVSLLGSVDLHRDTHNQRHLPSTVRTESVGISLHQMYQIRNNSTYHHNKHESFQKMANIVPEDMFQLEGMKRLKFLTLKPSTVYPKSMKPIVENKNIAEPEIGLESVEESLVSMTAAAATTKRLNSNQEGTDDIRDWMIDDRAKIPTLYGDLSTQSTPPVPNEKQNQQVLYDLSTRLIRCLSTYSNMKYMKIGDTGLVDLTQALQYNTIIQSITLANARISSNGIQTFSSVLPDIYSLTYLDLSCNLIDDNGAIAIANQLRKASKLQTLSLAGNRISLEGALTLVDVVLRQDCSVVFLSLKNNQLNESEQEIISKLMEDHQYYHFENQMNRKSAKIFMRQQFPWKDLESALNRIDSETLLNKKFIL